MTPATTNSAHFRTVLGHVPTSVVVIAGLDTGGEPRGMCVGSFTSVSLDPPMVLFCVAKSSTTWPLIEPGGQFAVNVLGEHQHTLGGTFASSRPDRFDDVAWQLSPLGSPVLEGVVAWLDCTTVQSYDAGDHFIVTALVNSLDAAATAEAVGPLVFHRGEFSTIDRSDSLLRAVAG